MKKHSQFVKFVSIPRKLHPFKNPHRLPTEPMGIHHSPHTHTIPIPMGIPMEIPIPTAALVVSVLYESPCHCLPVVCCIYSSCRTDYDDDDYDDVQQKTRQQF